MIEGKVAVVTGGSRGMGAIIAEKLAQEGADVAVIYAGNEEKANAVCDKCITANNVRAGAYKCDVADFKSVKETVAALKKDFGTVDILINNAGDEKVTRLQVVDEVREAAMLHTTIFAMENEHSRTKASEVGFPTII